MKGLILYYSKYGSCEAVAYKLKEKLNVDCMKYDSFDGNLMTYDYIVLGFSVYAGVLSEQGKSFIKEHKDILLGKPLYLFNTGLTKDEEGVKKIYEDNFDADFLTHVSYYQCLGGCLDFTRMNFMEKSIIKLINKKAQMVEKNQMKSRVDMIDNERIQMFAEKINTK